MRFSFRAAIFSTFLLIQPIGQANAADWVEQIRGNAQAVVIVRGGNFIKAEEMMSLEPGDIVKVLDDKTNVRILLGSGAIKKIAKAQSPFTVAGKTTGNSFLSNLMGELKGMLVASSDQTEAVAATSRDTSDIKPLAVVAADDEGENLVLAGFMPLLVAWQGGKAPYKVSLLGSESDTPLLTKADVSKSYMLIDENMTAKAGQDYEMVVESPDVKGEEGQEFVISLVDSKRLPADAQKLLAFRLDKRIEARLLINLLHKKKNWRLFAYSLAEHHELAAESHVLRVMK